VQSLYASRVEGCGAGHDTAFTPFSYGANIPQSTSDHSAIQPA
jgi:hypothetical protein